MSVSMQRVCVRCGRSGVQQYIHARQDGTPAVTGEAWVCANDRACRRRAAESGADQIRDTGGTSKLDAIAARLEAATPGRQTSDVHPDDVAALLAVVREVAALHQPEEWPPGLGEMVCRCCRNHPYPCPTATALNRLEKP